MAEGIKVVKAKVCEECGSESIELFNADDDLGAMFWWHCYNCGYNEEVKNWIIR